MEEEPYTVQEIRKKGKVKWVFESPTDNRVYPIEELMVKAPPGIYRFWVSYCTYSRPTSMNIHARDELEAFMKATKQLAKNKAKADKRRAKRTNQGANQ